MIRGVRAYVVVALALLIIAADVLAQNAMQSYPLLEASGIQHIASTSLGTQFDLLLLRLDPAIIDNKRFMRFFILLNNCDQRDGGLKMKNSLSSEFDYPGIAAFYRSKAAQVAATVPTSTNIIMANYPGADNRSAGFFLGDYNMSTNAFPFVDNRRNPVTVQFDHLTIVNLRQGLQCSWASTEFTGADANGFGPSSPVYRVEFKPLSFSKVQVPETDARAYVTSQGAAMRTVQFVLRLNILPDAPEVTDYPGTGRMGVTFHSEVKQILVLTPSHKQLATLNP